jgi:hypothetical protein
MNYQLLKLDYKPKPITSVDVLQAGSEFILIGDAKG